MTQETGRIVGEIALIAALNAGISYYLVRSRLKSMLEARRVAEHDADRTRAAADQQRREALLEAREASLSLRAEAEAELAEKRSVLDRLEQRLQDRDDSLEERRTTLERREVMLADRTSELQRRDDMLLRRSEELELELQRISGLTREAARDLYMSRLEGEFNELALRRMREIEVQSAAEAERQARSVVLGAVERLAVEFVNEATVAVVTLPSEEMKGRIIGREGRNIRAFEQVAGVDLIIDDTPEAVVISCFDPVRRETARLALMNLMVDGRIHPGRIEELYEQAQGEIDRTIRDAGERAAVAAGITGLAPQVVETMGKLRFRTSYAQNVLDHSVETAHLAAMFAAEFGLNTEIAKRAGFLHDIGKALDSTWEGPHALAGMEYLRQCGVREPILNAVGAHHHEIQPATPEANLVIVADQISAARPGARRESLDNYIKRLSSLEDLATAFPGVDRAYALQAGREVRLLVRPEIVDDLGASRLANEVARKIEADLDYPGTIRVTVIRETRAQETAK